MQSVQINGTDITRMIALRGMKWSRNDIDGQNAGRNLDGDLVRDRVATKIRLDITCRPLTDSEHTTLMNLLMPEFVSVSYNDPMFGRVTKVMYANNHNSEYCIRQKNGEEWWYNVEFPLIEK